MDKPTIKFVSVNRKTVKPYENNPRENEGAVGYVRESIAEFGFKRPVLVDEGMVVAAVDDGAHRRRDMGAVAVERGGEVARRGG